MLHRTGLASKQTKPFQVLFFFSLSFLSFGVCVSGLFLSTWEITVLTPYGDAAEANLNLSLQCVSCGKDSCFPLLSAAAAAGFRVCL